MAAEPEDDSRRVRRPESSEARPGGIEGHLGIGEQQGYPDPDEHCEDGPNHRQHNADLDRVVIVMGKPLFGRVRRVVAGEDDEDSPDAERENDETMENEGMAGGSRKEDRKDVGEGKRG